MRVRGTGPIPSRIMLVGEAPGEQEERTGEPFTGASGQELNRMLHEAGIMRSECYTTNVCKVRPPNNQISAFVARTKKEITSAHTLMRDRYVTKEVVEGYAELLTEIEMVNPNIIVCFGNLSMWALTGNWQILKWRGSLLNFVHPQPIPSSNSDINPNKTVKVIPTIHPAAILREWSNRAIVLNDLRRVKRHMVSRTYDNIPAWNFIIRPSYETVRTVLAELQAKVEQEPYWLDFDLETFITTKHIRCAGISWSRTEAICIPFTDGNDSYWPEEVEAEIVFLLYKLLTHPNALIRGQNLLFDCQYTHRYWHFIPNVKQDTMIAQHSVFSAMPKALDFIASLYADYYVNWKMEEK